MRTFLLLTLAAALAPASLADDNTINEGIVKDVRALLSATNQKDIDSAKQKLFSRSDLDWPSVKQGLMAGRYYRDPLSTQYGTVHSGKHLRLRLMGKDTKERGFSVYLPKGYKAKQKIPVLLYLHHNSSTHTPNQGATLVFSALAKFRKAAEKHGVLFVAPYTCQGAEWWRPEGMRLVQWTLARIKERYNIDEDRVALMGAQDGADGVWYLGQEMPGSWSCLMPMSGSHYSITAMVRPLYLGTLDRMDVFCGVAGAMRRRLGDTDVNKFLAGLKPLFGQKLRITAAIDATAQGDFRYLPRIREQVMSWVLNKKRKALADEVDIESNTPTRGLWLEVHGPDPEGTETPTFKTTRLKWTAPEPKEPEPKIGVNLHPNPNWEVGAQITKASGAAQREGILAGDILIEVGDTRVKKVGDVKAALKGLKWGDEVRLLLVREIKESELERSRKREAYYMKMLDERRELRAAGQPVPEGFMDAPEEDEEDEDEDDEGETTIEYGGDDEEDGGDASEKTVMLPFVRYVHLRRPEGDNLVRADFGARWDRGHKGPGVKVVGLVPGSLAQRSGMQNGDIIVAAGSDTVDRPKDLREFFGDFKFEKAPKGERFVEFTVTRKGVEHTVHVSWEPPVAARVDVKWDKKEKALKVLVRRAKGFTVYFTDELIKPGVDFHLYVNNVPYRDLVDPATTPEYPEITLGTDSWVRESRRVLRRKRSKVEGWEPDIRWAVENALEQRDRALVMGAKRSFDLTSMKKGLLAAKERRKKRQADRGARIKKAHEEYKSRG